jgi:ribosomal protein S18 acetylase RimI-like enzyme
VSPDFVLEPLDADHDGAAFSCGQEALDRYIKEQAGQDARRRIAAVFISRAAGTVTVNGYYTLATFGIAPDSLPPEVTKRLPRYDQFPATRIGRLAVDRSCQGKGVGRRLLMDALDRSARMARHIASMAVVVDAKDDEARGFYERYGFRRFQDYAYRLYLPITTIERLLEAHVGPASAVPLTESNTQSEAKVKSASSQKTP